MIPDDAADIIHGLYEKTHAAEAPWIEVPVLMPGAREAFRITLDTVTINLIVFHDETIYFSILNDEGGIVLEFQLRQYEPDYQLLREMAERAHRQVRRIDASLSEVRGWLGGSLRRRPK